MSLYDHLREIADRVRRDAPWIAWAQQHPVALVRSEWLPADTGYVMPVTEDDFGVAFLVIAHPEMLRQVRAEFRVPGSFPPSDQRLAEIIAWLHVEMPEPGELTGAAQ